MKKILILLGFLFINNTYSQYQEWAKVFNSGSNSTDEATLIKIDNEGNAVVSGTAYITGNSEDICVVKYSPSGAQLWSVTYNGTGDDYDEPLGLAIDNQNNVYVTGMTYQGGGNYDIVTVKYNSSGTEQWVKIWAGAQGFSDKAYGIYADISGNIYITGSTEVTSGTNYNFITVKYNSAGVLQWEKQYNHTFNRADIPLFITGNSNGIYIVGNSEAQGTGNDMLTLKYDLDGNQLWASRYSGALSINEIPAGIVVDAANNVYITCRTEGTGTGTDYMTVKYNPSGDSLWTARYTSPGGAQDIPEGIAIDGSGNVIVTGRTRINSTYNDFGTVKYNSSGVQQWLAVYNNTGADGDDYAYDIVTDAQGNIYVTGNSQASGSDRDALTIKYNSSGVEQWVARYDVTNSEETYAMALDASGNVFLTGYQSGASIDFLTIKYSQANGISSISNEIPAGFKLSQNYPNPFNPVTNINFSIPKAGNVKLIVYDALGKEISELVNDRYNAGTYSVDFDAAHLSTGVYFYKLESGEFTNIKKMILIK